LPMRIIKQRIMLAGTFVMLFLSGGIMLIVYYLPLWCKFSPDNILYKCEWEISLTKSKSCSPSNKGR
jgi:hypothetical protein